MKTCKICKFRRGFECCRFPPIKNTDTGNFQYPRVKTEKITKRTGIDIEFIGWCGEFKKKEHRMKKENSEFYNGIKYACFLLSEKYDFPKIAENILRECGISKSIKQVVKEQGE